MGALSGYTLNAAEWADYKQAIVEVMRDYPEARTDLIEALRESAGYIELAHDLALALALDAGRPPWMNKSAGPIVGQERNN